jgi:hypothetical protein
LRPKLPKLANFLDEAEANVLGYMSFPARDRVPGSGVAGGGSPRSTGIGRIGQLASAGTPTA